MPTMLTPDTLGAESVTAPQLAALPGIRHGFFTRRGGMSGGCLCQPQLGVGSGDSLPLVLNNRARVASALGVRRERLVSPYQVHGAVVAVATELWETGKGPEADGIVTKERGLAVGVGTADCAPILFADAEAGVIGAAHAGWGGAFRGVLEATLDRMLDLGARKARIVAAIGPTMAQESYEVGPEFVQRFLSVDLNNARYFRPSVKEACNVRPAGLRRRPARSPRAPLGDRTRARHLCGRGSLLLLPADHPSREKDYGRMISAIVLA